MLLQMVVLPRGFRLEGRLERQLLPSWSIFGQGDPRANVLLFNLGLASEKTAN